MARVVDVPVSDGDGLSNDDEEYYLEIEFDRPVTSVGGLAAFGEGLKKRCEVRAFDEAGNEIEASLLAHTADESLGGDTDNTEVWWSVASTGSQSIARVHLILLDENGGPDFASRLALTGLRFNQHTPIGDSNFDGASNNLDIRPFELGLASGESYLADFPGRVDYAQQGDTNGDGVFNNLDIRRFEAILAGRELAALSSPAPHAAAPTNESVWNREDSDVTRSVFQDSHFLDEVELGGFHEQTITEEVLSSRASRIARRAARFN